MAIKIADVMLLATLSDAESTAALNQVLLWRYEHSLAVAKAVAGAGLAVLLSLLVPLIQPDPSKPISESTWIVVLIGAAVSVAIGAVFFGAAARKHREFIAAHKLLADLREIRPFLTLIMNGSA